MKREFTLYVDEELYRRFKCLCVIRRRSMSTGLTEALVDHIQKHAVFTTPRMPAKTREIMPA